MENDWNESPSPQVSPTSEDEDPLDAQPLAIIAVEKLNQFIITLNDLTAQVRQQKDLYPNNPTVQQTSSLFLQYRPTTDNSLNSLTHQINLSLPFQDQE